MGLSVHGCSSSENVYAGVAEAVGAAVYLDRLTDSDFVKGLRDAIGTAIASVYVLDEQMQFVPGGHITVGRNG